MSNRQGDPDKSQSAEARKGNDGSTVLGSARAAGLTSLLLASAVAFGVDFPTTDKASAEARSGDVSRDVDPVVLRSALLQLAQVPPQPGLIGPPPWHNWQNFQNWQNY